ncbi:hypothetical protein GCM10007285_09950 [Stappia taiwanensis]|nr:hypothetical protein GCM10007285_09950 [Stappia taiwanensis]
MGMSAKTPAIAGVMTMARRAATFHMADKPQANLRRAGLPFKAPPPATPLDGAIIDSEDRNFAVARRHSVFVR